MGVTPGNDGLCGAVVVDGGVDFGVFSPGADRVELCLFGPGDPTREVGRVDMSRGAGGVWRVRVADAAAGACYGFRAHGPYEPSAGLRFNPNKLLVDPWARALTVNPGWDDGLHGFVWGDGRADLSFDARDSAAFVPKSVVVEHSFDWGDERRLGTSWEDTLIYECHVKGLTVRHPEVAAELRGTYLGLCSPPIVDHLRRLGVTAVELLPIHHSFCERHLSVRGLRNYWGYNTLGFFAPDVRFAAVPGRQVVEFQAMVRGLHEAGIEVILDVVFNHSAEGDHLGPTLSFRGLDNGEYYRLCGADRRMYENPTGCGNALDFRSPVVREMVLSCLRYWVEEMHVDGFRFDLATVLARGDEGFDAGAPFLEAVRRDAVLGGVKLIAEPWDIGLDGYQVGAFPAEWSEWNDAFGRSARAFWRGDGVGCGELARRLGGSSDIFEGSGRTARASVQYLASHDGFSLRDVVSYERKHNEANGEENRDGMDDNLSRNWGVEGETEDGFINGVRDRVARCLLATLFCSRGVPMLSAGDELGRTQRGNNNAYCQDNEISWVDWSSGSRERELLEFVRGLSTLRRKWAVWRRDAFYTGAVDCDGGAKDVTWLREDGAEMTKGDWNDGTRQVFAMKLHDCAARASVFVAFNASREDRVFGLSRCEGDGTWRLELDTASPEHGDEEFGKDCVTVSSHSVKILAYTL